MDQSYLFIGLAVIFSLVIFLVLILIKQNRQNGNMFSGRRIMHVAKKSMVSGLAAGIGIGLALGVALDNIAVGIAIGVAIGSSLGLSFDAASKKREQKNHLYTKPEMNARNASNNTVFLALLTILIGIIALGLMLFFVQK